VDHPGGSVVVGGREGLVHTCGFNVGVAAVVPDVAVLDVVVLDVAVLDVAVPDRASST
jgi:hypothetical protein